MYAALEVLWGPQIFSKASKVRSKAFRSKASNRSPAKRQEAEPRHSVVQAHGGGYVCIFTFLAYLF